MRLPALFTAVSVAIAAIVAAPAPAQTPKAAGKKAPVARDWRTHVVMQPSGAYAIGNPAAKVKLVEYLSYTCSHCAHFVADSKAPLHDDLVRRGAVRVEFQHAVRDPMDMAAALLARCAGPRGFAAASQAIFAAQADWYGKGANWWQSNGTATQGQPMLTRLKGLANAAGLTAMMQARGMAPAAINQCFANQAELTRLEAMSNAAWASINGTPSFVINGTSVGSSDWATLEPKLRAAGAR